MEVFNDENENKILSQFADATENIFYEIKPFEDKHEDILLLKTFDRLLCSSTVKILDFRINIFRQTVQTQIRLLFHYTMVEPFSSSFFSSPEPKAHM